MWGEENWSNLNCLLNIIHFCKNINVYEKTESLHFRINYRMSVLCPYNEKNFEIFYSEMTVK